MEINLDRVNSDIEKLRKLNIKIDIVNNQISKLILKTDIYIRGFSKINLDKTIDEIADNIDGLYLRRDEYKQEIADIECFYRDRIINCNNIYECRYYIKKEADNNRNV